MDRPIDDIVKSLLQFVVRGFYSGTYVLVLDAIMFHSVLSEEDLAHLLGIKRPELRALTSTLMDDMLVAMHSQQEFSYNSRSLRRYYYYIKYPQAIDAIKWKVHQLVSKMKEDLDNNSAPQGYMCLICNSKYSQLEAVSLLNFEKTQFLCSLCEEALVEDDSGKKSKEKQMRLNKLMDQIQPIIDYLKKIDDSMIDENTFETALVRLIPPQNNSAASYTLNPRTRRSKMFQPGEALGNESSRRAGFRSQATLHVNITTVNDELAQKELQERKVEEKRKQNALPTWHEKSTIGKSLGMLDENETKISGENSATTPSAEVELKGDVQIYEPEIDEDNYGEQDASLIQQNLANKEAERTLAEYYAKLAKKQAMEDDEDDDEDEDEDEDEEFENVIVEYEEDIDMKELEEIEMETKSSTGSSNSKSSAAISASQGLNSNTDGKIEDDRDEESMDDEFEDV